MKKVALHTRNGIVRNGSETSRTRRGAPSFNGRTADSGSAYRGSNPWGAANEINERQRFTSEDLLYPCRVLNCLNLVSIDSRCSDHASALLADLSNWSKVTAHRWQLDGDGMANSGSCRNRVLGSGPKRACADAAGYTVPLVAPVGIPRSTRRVWRVT